MNSSKIRWVRELANYNFNVKYRPSKLSTDCDYLSRHSIELPQLIAQCVQEVPSENIGSKQRGKFAEIKAVIVPGLGKKTIPDNSPT